MANNLIVSARMAPVRRVSKLQMIWTTPPEVEDVFTQAVSAATGPVQFVSDGPVATDAYVLVTETDSNKFDATNTVASSNTKAVMSPTPVVPDVVTADNTVEAGGSFTNATYSFMVLAYYGPVGKERYSYMSSATSPGSYSQWDGLVVALNNKVTLRFMKPLRPVDHYVVLLQTAATFVITNNAVRVAKNSETDNGDGTYEIEIVSETADSDTVSIAPNTYSKDATDDFFYFPGDVRLWFPSGSALTVLADGSSGDTGVMAVNADATLRTAAGGAGLQTKVEVATNLADAVVDNTITFPLGGQAQVSLATRGVTLEPVIDIEKTPRELTAKAHDGILLHRDYNRLTDIDRMDIVLVSTSTNEQGYNTLQMMANEGVEVSIIETIGTTSRTYEITYHGKIRPFTSHPLTPLNTRDTFVLSIDIFEVIRRDQSDIDRD